MKNPFCLDAPRIATGRAETPYFARANRGGKFIRHDNDTSMHSISDGFEPKPAKITKILRSLCYLLLMLSQ